MTSRHFSQGLINSKSAIRSPDCYSVRMAQSKQIVLNNRSYSTPWYCWRSCDRVSSPRCCCYRVQSLLRNLSPSVTTTWAVLCPLYCCYQLEWRTISDLLGWSPCLKVFRVKYPTDIQVHPNKLSLMSSVYRWTGNLNSQINSSACCTNSRSQLYAERLCS